MFTEAELELIREALKRMATDIYRCKPPREELRLACQQLLERLGGSL